jgi:hypothetical protein
VDKRREVHFDENEAEGFLIFSLFWKIENIFKFFFQPNEGKKRKLRRKPRAASS